MTSEEFRQRCKDIEATGLFDNSSYWFGLKGMNFTLCQGLNTASNGKVTWFRSDCRDWWMFPPISFEEVLNECPDDLKVKLLFHLDLLV